MHDTNFMQKVDAKEDLMDDCSSLCLIVVAYCLKPPMKIATLYKLANDEERLVIFHHLKDPHKVLMINTLQDIELC